MHARVSITPTRAPLLLAGLLLWVAGCASFSSVPPGTVAVAPSALLATIPVGRGPTYLAIAPDGSRVYAASDGSLTVIGTSGNTVLATRSIDANPTGIAVTPDGSKVLITNLFADRVTVLDATTNTIAAPIGLFGERFTGGFGRIAMVPNSPMAWIANQDNEVLAILHTDGSNATSRDIDMRPVDIAFSPDGSLAYVAGCRYQCVPGTVEVIDSAKRTTQAYLDVGPSPYRIAMAPDGAHFYTTNLAAASLSVVDVRTHAVTATVHVGVEPTGLAATRDGTRIYVVSQDAGTLTIIDTTTNAVRQTLRVGNQAREVVVTPDGRRLYVSTLNSVLVLDAGALTGGSQPQP